LGVGCAGGVGCAAAAGFFSSFWLAASPPSICAITLPLRNAIAFLIAIDFTTPAAVDGTSIVAFSVSSVISGVSDVDLVAGFHQYVDDFDVLEIPEVGNRDVLRHKPTA
jgi:hypothetical protein